MKKMGKQMIKLEYNRLFFENGGRPGTVLKHQKEIKPEVREKYLAKWKENFVGLKNANKVGCSLNEAMEAK